MKNFLIELLGGVTTEAYDALENTARCTRRDLDAKYAEGVKHGLETREEKYTTVQMMRLTEHALNQVRLQANATTIVNQQTTELMAAHQLGVQHVLNILQKDFTIQTP